MYKTTSPVMPQNTSTPTSRKSKRVTKRRFYRTNATLWKRRNHMRGGRLVAKRKRRTMKHKRYLCRLRSLGRRRRAVGGMPGDVKDGSTVTHKITFYTPDIAVTFGNKIKQLAEAEGIHIQPDNNPYESGLYAVLNTTYKNVLDYLQTEVHMTNRKVWLVEQFVGERRSFCITLIHIERKPSEVMPDLSPNRYCMQIGIYKTKEQYMYEKDMKKKGNGYTPQKLREQLQTFVESMAKGEQEKKRGPKLQGAYSHILVCPFNSMGYHLLMAGFKMLKPQDKFSYHKIVQFFNHRNTKKFRQPFFEKLNEGVDDVSQQAKADDYDEDTNHLCITHYPQFKKFVFAIDDATQIVCDLLLPPEETNDYKVTQHSSNKIYVKPKEVNTTDSYSLFRIFQFNSICFNLCDSCGLLCKPLQATTLQET